DHGYAAVPAPSSRGLATPAAAIASGTTAGHAANGGAGSITSPPSSRPTAPTSASSAITARAVASPLEYAGLRSSAIANAGRVAAISDASRSIVRAGAPVIASTLSGV